MIWFNVADTTREDRFRNTVQARPTISVWRAIFVVLRKFIARKVIDYQLLLNSGLLRGNQYIIKIVTAVG